MEINNICRICLKEADPKLPVFTDDEGRSKSYMTLPKKIMSLAKVQVLKGDGLPPHICVKCYYLVDTSLELKRLCEESYRFLIEQLGYENGTHELPETEEGINFTIHQTRKRKIKTEEVEELVSMANGTDYGEEFNEDAMEVEFKEGEYPIEPPALQITDVSSMGTAHNFTNEDNEMSIDGCWEFADVGDEMSDVYENESVPPADCDMTPDKPSTRGNHPPFNRPFSSSDNTYNDFVEINFRKVMNEKNVEEYECVKCNQRFPDYRKGVAHVKRVLCKGRLNRAASSESLSKKWTCYSCGMTFDTRRELSFHISLRHRSCNSCGEYFNTNLSKEAHTCGEVVVKKKKTNSSDYTQFCGDCNISVRNMTLHRRSLKHRGIKAKLEESQAKGENLESRNVFSNPEQIFNKFLTNPSNKGESQTDIECTLCQLRCISMSGFKIHMQRMHRDHRIVYHCDLCNTQFFNKASCEKHMVEEHGEANTHNLQFEFRPVKNCQNVDPSEEPKKVRKRSVYVNKFECSYCTLKLSNFGKCLEHLFIAHKSSNAQKIKILRERENDAEIPKSTEVEIKKIEVEKVDKPNKVEKFEKTTKVEKIEKTTKVEKIEKVEKQNKGEKAEKTSKGEKSNKVERVEKVDKPEKLEKADKVVKTEKIDKVEKEQQKIVRPKLSKVVNPILKPKFSKKRGKPLPVPSKLHPPFKIQIPFTENNFEAIEQADGKRKYKCLVCNFVYNCYQSAYKHFASVRRRHAKPAALARVPESKPFGCKFCHLKFASRSQAITHRKQVHKSLRLKSPLKSKAEQESKQVEKLQKSEEDESLQKLRTKIILDKKQKDSPLAKESLSAKEKTESKLTSSASEKSLSSVDSKFRFERIILCKKCHRTFETAKDLAEHEAADCEKESSDQKTNHDLQCKKCKEKFNLKSIYDIHVASKLCAEQFLCNLCKKQCKSKAHLLKHQLSHEANIKRPSLTCSKCKKKFRSQVKLKRHFASCHREKVKKMKKLDDVIDMKGVSDLNGELNLLLREDQTFSCNVCEATDMNLDAYEEHVFAAHQDYELHLKCSECEAAFDSMQSCEEHVKAEHPSKDATACPVCVPVSQSESGNPYKCDQCESQFLVFEGLQVHIKTMHPVTDVPEKTEIKVKDEAVSSADASGPMSPKNLEVIDLSDNSDSKNSSCSESDSYNEISTEDDSENEQPFFCKLCDKTFRKEDELISHLSSQMHIDMRLVKLTKNRMSDKDK